MELAATLTGAQLLGLPRTFDHTSRRITRALASDLLECCSIDDRSVAAAMQAMWDRIPTLWAEGVAHPGTPVIRWSDIPQMARRLVERADAYADVGFLQVFYAVARFGHDHAATLHLVAPQLGEPDDSEELGVVGDPQDQADAEAEWCLTEDEETEDEEEEDVIEIDM